MAIIAIIVSFIVGIMWGMGLEKIISQDRRRRHLLAIVRRGYGR